MFKKKKKNFFEKEEEELSIQRRRKKLKLISSLISLTAGVSSPTSPLESIGTVCRTRGSRRRNRRPSNATVPPRMQNNKKIEFVSC